MYSLVTKHEFVLTFFFSFIGELLSVNPNLSKYLPNLFTFNERVILRGEWQHGFFSMTPVGGTNVGTITIFDDEVFNVGSGSLLYI